MYTVDQAKHAETAIKFNSKVNVEDPVLMTGQGFLCFKPYLDQPKPAMTGGAGVMYEIAMALPKDCPATKDIMTHTKAIFDKTFNGQRGARKPFKDGDTHVETLLEDATPEEAVEIEQKYGALRGHIFFNAKTKYPLNTPDRDPQLIDAKKTPVDASKVFGGSIVRIQIAPYTYNQQGNKGLAFGLRAVQILKKSDWKGTAASNSAQNFDEATSDEPTTPADSFDDSDDMVDSAPAKPAKVDKPAKQPKPVKVAEDESLDDDDMFS